MLAYVAGFINGRKGGLILISYLEIEMLCFAAGLDCWFSD